LNLLDKIERSWEWRAPRGDRNKFRSTLYMRRPIPLASYPRGDRNKFRSTLCWKRAPRTTRQAWTGVNGSGNCY